MKEKRNISKCLNGSSAQSGGVGGGGGQVSQAPVFIIYGPFPNESQECPMHPRTPS